MNGWFIPTGIVFIGFIVWMFAFLFGNKKVLVIGSIIGNVIVIFGILLLWHKKYISFAGILICIQGFIIIFNFAFSMPKKRIKNDSPLGKFIGKEGICLEDFNPTGEIKIGDDVFKSSSEGLFIPKNSKAKVIRAGEKILVVEKVE